MMKRILLTGWLACAGLAATAQGPQDQEALREIAARIRSIKTYAYDAEVRGMFPNGDADTMTTRLYMDGAGRRIFYKTPFQEYLLTPLWAYQADHNTATAGVFRVSAYNARHKNTPRLDSYFNNNLAETFIDSVLLRTATIRSVKKHKDLATLDLVFPGHSYLRGMVIVYNNRTQLPVEIRIRTFYPDSRYPAQDGRLKGASYEIVCKNYTETVPEAVFDTRRYFTVKEGKVVLTTFKKYRLTTIL